MGWNVKKSRGTFPPPQQQIVYGRVFHLDSVLFGLPFLENIALAMPRLMACLGARREGRGRPSSGVVPILFAWQRAIKFDRNAIFSTSAGSCRLWPRYSILMGDTYWNESFVFFTFVFQQLKKGCWRFPASVAPVY
ncbi:hypothetical protein CEXT_645911 [Caerostris extrusa]|uniref:Uncharacterized protein n=1 Tax=Caerostris extrusa TaxID=172846 RepID=A0AAV4ME94_CAEEX|nr:hypothetical protein CEXT_645911 [Caerostris extrusa]